MWDTTGSVLEKKKKVIWVEKGKTYSMLRRERVLEENEASWGLVVARKEKRIKLLVVQWGDENGCTEYKEEENERIKMCSW